MAPPPAPSAHLARLLTRAAVPLVRSSHPFRASTLQLASLDLPAPHTPSETYSDHTIHALYPSPPAADATANDFSLKGLLIGNGGKRSRSRQELIALARGEGTASAHGEKERTGPARALVEEWLREGRREMVRSVKESGFKGEKAYRFGVAERLKYSAEIGEKLPEALAILSAPRNTYLNNLLEAIPLPHVTPHLSHVAHIAQDLAKAAGSEAQGTAWYSLRLRLSTVYALSELQLFQNLLSSPSSPDSLKSAIALSASLFDQSAALGEKMDDAVLYAEWVRKSWMGLARSAGV
ncbi:hypothetical protein JCM8097_006779 [Rhodosporidiobolus ruineniae]